MVKDLFVFLQGLFEIVSFIYRSQTRIAAPTSMLMILRNHLNSKEHSIVFLSLKAKAEKMKKRGTDFRQMILLAWLVGVEPTEQRLFTASCKFQRH